MISKTEKSESDQLQASTSRETYDLEAPHPGYSHSHSQLASLGRDRHYVV